MFRSIWFTFVLLLHLSAATALLAAELPVVREVVASREGSGARIEIRADQPLNYSSYLMPQLSKWVIDLPGATSVFPGDEAKKMRTPPLERISVRQKEVNGEKFTRIGLDFSGNVDFSIMVDPVDKKILVVRLNPSQGAPEKNGIETSPSVIPPSVVKGIVPIAGAAAKMVTQVRIGTDFIRVEADGTLSVPSPMILDKPGRLVLDLAAVTSGLDKVSVPANSFGIVRSRLGKKDGKLRIVFEVGGDRFPDVKVREIMNGLEIIPAAK